MTATHSLSIALVLAVSLLACGDDAGGGGGAGGEAALGGEGAPCEKDEQCAAGLTCDTAHAEATCQPPHTDGPQTGTGGNTSATTSGVGGGGGAGGGEGGGGGGGEPDSPCALLCACLDEACSEFAGYPYADGDACLAACAAITDEELSCWGAFCEQAAEAVSGAEHLCEHAWGGAGTDECE